MMAAAFCARLPYALVIKLLAVTNQLPHKRLSDIPSFPYYKIESAVATVLNATARRPRLPLKIRKRNYFQLELLFGVFLKNGGWTVILYCLISLLSFLILATNELNIS